MWNSKTMTALLRTSERYVHQLSRTFQKLPELSEILSVFDVYICSQPKKLYQARQLKCCPPTVLISLWRYLNLYQNMNIIKLVHDLEIRQRSLKLVIYSKARANLNKSLLDKYQHWKYIPRRLKISINWNPLFQTSLQSQFSMSKIIQIFLNFFFIEEYQFRDMFLLLTFFENFNF